MKNDLRGHLTAQGIEVTDLGVNDETPAGYPDVGSGLAREPAAGAFERGILICGTGAGMAIAAKITGQSVARMLADIFIRNSFQGGRSAPKVAKLEALDQAR